jgi:hypothetical protein
MPGVADILGPQGPLRDAIASRLDTIPYQQYQHDDPHQLEIGVGVEASGLTILPWSEEKILHNSPLILVMDVITDTCDPLWEDGTFHSIIADAISGSDMHCRIKRPRFWLSVSDVAEAIRIMVIENKLPSPSQPLLMAGRRPWWPEAVYSEAAHLWNRYSASVEGTHDPSTLKEPPLVPLPRGHGDIARPNLDHIDRHMRNCGEPHGWRPSGSLRLAIMRVFANLFE